MPTIKVEGLDEIRARFRQFPQVFRSKLEVTLKAALDVIWESVPPYPEPPPESTYRRTGTLGRSLGSNFSGGKGEGQPDIYEVNMGPQMSSASFGTRLGYATHVIGEGTQAPIHAGRWWTMLTIAKRALPKLQKLFERMAQTMAKWLEGKGF